MKCNPLPSQEDLLRVLRYEPGTGKLYWKPRPIEMFGSEGEWRRWNKRYAGAEAFTTVSNGYRKGRLFGRDVLAHRVVWVITKGGEAPEIDHETGNRSDNREGNLREGGSLENMRNKALPINSTCGVMGVAWHRGVSKWQALIGVRGKRRYLGVFTNFNDAVAARKAAERELGFHVNHGRSRRAA